MKASILCHLLFLRKHTAFSQQEIDEVQEVFNNIYQQKLYEGFLPIGETSKTPENSEGIENQEKSKGDQIKEEVTSQMREELREIDLNNLKIDVNEPVTSSDPVYTESILLTPLLRNEIGMLNKFAKESKCQINFHENNVEITGDETHIDKFLSKLYDYEMAPDLRLTDSEKLESAHKVIEIDIPVQGKSDIENYIAKGSDLDVITVSPDKKLVFGGKTDKIIKLVQYMYEKQIVKEFKKTEIEALYINKKLHKTRITLSPFLRDDFKKIKESAQNFSVEIDFDINYLNISGRVQDVTAFQIMLRELENEVKLKLYPQFWDHNVLDTVKIIPVQKGSVEYTNVEQRFKQTLRGITILKINRIQNRPLMEKFLLFQQEYKENNAGKDLNKRMLFHGTRYCEPEIVATCETGFDLQYAAFGAYGKGLYFGSTAEVSLGYVQPINGVFKMILAEVVLGKTFDSRLSFGEKYIDYRHLIKPPDGYDSVEAYPGTPNSFFIIYKYFLSYPLYIAEWKDNYAKPFF